MTILRRPPDALPPNRHSVRVPSGTTAEATRFQATAPGRQRSGGGRRRKQRAADAARTGLVSGDADTVEMPVSRDGAPAEIEERRKARRGVAVVALGALAAAVLGAGGFVLMKQHTLDSNRCDYGLTQEWENCTPPWEKTTPAANASSDVKTTPSTAPTSTSTPSKTTSAGPTAPAGTVYVDELDGTYLAANRAQYDKLAGLADAFQQPYRISERVTQLRSNGEVDVSDDFLSALGDKSAAAYLDPADTRKAAMALLKAAHPVDDQGRLENPSGELSSLAKLDQQAAVVLKTRLALQGMQRGRVVLTPAELSDAVTVVPDILTNAARWSRGSGNPTPYQASNREAGILAEHVVDGLDGGFSPSIAGVDHEAVAAIAAALINSSGANIDGLDPWEESAVTATVLDAMVAQDGGYGALVGS